MIKRALVGCETSGNTRRALQARGIVTFSCDLLASDDNSPWHMRMDVRRAIDYYGRGFFDLFVVHPTCRFLSRSGLHWNARGVIVDGRPRSEWTTEAVAFAKSMMEVDVPHIVMENPVGCLSTRYRKPDQVIHPYQFGHDASKATCLWLKNFPKLPVDPALYVQPRMVNGRPRWANQNDKGQNNLPETKDRWKIRSETYRGISDAIAAVAVSL